MSLENNNLNGENGQGYDIDERPQYLCKTCGRCCKTITTSHTYEELKELTEKGCEEARVFIEIFKPYSSIEEVRKVDPAHVKQILDTLSETGDWETDPNLDLNKITFFYCPNIQDDGKCGIYETRPECCRRGPHHGWSVFPPGCGFEGWQFEQREKKKKAVRMLKEHLYAVESISVDGKVPNKDMTIEEYKKYVEEKIKPWEKFGSKYW